MGETVASETMAREQALDAWMQSQRSALDIKAEEDERLRKEATKQNNEAILQHYVDQLHYQATTKQEQKAEKLKERERLERLCRAAEELKLVQRDENRRKARDVMDYQLKQQVSAK
jgi:hypothetical protein